jgi:hypothetical protein
MSRKNLPLVDIFTNMGGLRSKACFVPPEAGQADLHSSARAGFFLGDDWTTNKRGSNN